MAKPFTDHVAIAASGLQVLHEAVHRAHRAPLLRSQKMHSLIGQWAKRGLEDGTAAMTVLRLDANAWEELHAFQSAVLERFAEQQRDWFEGCAAVVQEYGELKRANTMAKFVEQEYNVAVQIGALFATQAANFVGLLETIQVDYGYWIHQKQTPPDVTEESP
jgi:hypothetical protein